MSAFLHFADARCLVAVLFAESLHDIRVRRAVGKVAYSHSRRFLQPVVDAQVVVESPSDNRPEDEGFLISLVVADVPRQLEVVPEAVFGEAIPVEPVGLSGGLLVVLGQYETVVLQRHVVAAIAAVAFAALVVAGALAVVDIAIGTAGCNTSAAVAPDNQVRHPIDETTVRQLGL